MEQFGSKYLKKKLNKPICKFVLCFYVFFYDQAFYLLRPSL